MLTREEIAEIVQYCKEKGVVIGNEKYIIFGKMEYIRINLPTISPPPPVNQIIFISQHIKH